MAFDILANDCAIFLLNPVKLNDATYAVSPYEVTARSPRKKYYWLCEKGHIVPIYNSPNLEEVMIKARIMTKKIPDAQKGSYYSKVFPINQDPFSNDTLEQIHTLSKKLQEVKGTNLLEYVNYCLSLINQV